ncbi:uncharacterized protein LOC117491563 [Trematomus bernacchii]|uniref:uncharacterized protein LOC117491563 n=1 Tax=Trematomus bernacchii TaxID=40690 RepID=UPI00146A59C9|nr:uncharacterized protein LOC117491563 [Trematomus bernacchii]
MEAELAVTEKQLEDWVRDVNEWAETTTNNPRDAAALASKIEMLTVSVKRRSQRLYKDTDSNKGRSRIRRKIRDEKGVLTATVEKYNSMVPSTEALCLEAILSVEKAWPWQLPNSDSFDLRTKRRTFDLVMAVKRLQEEKKILITEMNHHWKRVYQSIIPATPTVTSQLPPQHPNLDVNKPTETQQKQNRADGCGPKNTAPEVLFGVTCKALDRLQYVQNSAARLLTRTKPWQHITPTLLHLHWLPVKSRIQYKLLLLTYTSLHSLAPAYISDLLQPYTPSRQLRSSDKKK